MKGISGADLRPDNPAKGSNWLSIATFWYTLKIFNIGLKRDFCEDDLTRPLEGHKSQVLGERLARQWSKERDKVQKSKRKRKPSFICALIRTFGCEIAWYGVALGLLELGARIYQPLFVGLIIRYFSIQNQRNKIQ